MDPEKADISDSIHKEDLPADEILAQYSEEEKAKAFKKLDWSLIPLYDSISSVPRSQFRPAADSD
jgi:hypothetical protein